MIPAVTLALTAGEPAGIGPELCLQLAAEKRTAGLVVVASKALLEVGCFTVRHIRQYRLKPEVVASS